MVPFKMYHTQANVTAHTIRLVVACRNARKTAQMDAENNIVIASGVEMLVEATKNASNFITLNQIRKVVSKTQSEKNLLKVYRKACKKLALINEKANRQIVNTMLLMNTQQIEFKFGKVYEATPAQTFALLDEFEKFEDDGGMEAVKVLLPKHLYKNFKAIAYDFINKTLEQNAIVAKFLHNDMMDMIKEFSDKLWLPESQKIQFLKLKSYKLTVSELRTKIRKWKYSIGRTNNEATKAELQAKIEETEALIATMEA